MDRWLPELSCAELKVLLYLMRRTFGFQREQHAAGLRRICNGTGLHLETVADAVKRLRARGLLSYKGRPGQRNVYTLRFTKEVYGKSEHVERKSSSETKPKKENYKGRLADQDAEPPKVRQTISKPIHSNSDDDEPKNKAGQEISRDLLNRISETRELRGVSMSRFLDELQPHVPNHWKNPAGFLTDFARKFKSKASGSATAQTSVSALTVKEPPRCTKCHSIGRVDGGQCH